MQLKKCCIDPNRDFSIEEIQMDEKHHRKFLRYLTIKEIQTKATLRFNPTPFIMAKTQVSSHSIKIS